MVYYRKLGYRQYSEDEQYPLSEMLNELAGIIGFYFGISFISLAAVFYQCERRIRRLTPFESLEAAIHRLSE